MVAHAKKNKLEKDYLKLLIECLPDKLWVVELSCRELFSGTRAKFGEVLLTVTEVNVRLEMAATEDELVAIANEIKNKTRKSYERTNILFWLPGMEVGTGAWARVTFNPDFERVHIMGD